MLYRVALGVGPALSVARSVQGLGRRFGAAGRRVDGRACDRGCRGVCACRQARPEDVCHDGGFGTILASDSRFRGLPAESDLSGDEALYRVGEDRQKTGAARSACDAARREAVGRDRRGGGSDAHDPEGRYGRL